MGGGFHYWPNPPAAPAVVCKCGHPLAAHSGSGVAGIPCNVCGVNRRGWPTGNCMGWDPPTHRTACLTCGHPEDSHGAAEGDSCYIAGCSCTKFEPREEVDAYADVLDRERGSSAAGADVTGPAGATTPPEPPAGPPCGCSFSTLPGKEVVCAERERHQGPHQADGVTWTRLFPAQRAVPAGPPDLHDLAIALQRTGAENQRLLSALRLADSVITASLREPSSHAAAQARDEQARNDLALIREVTKPYDLAEDGVPLDQAAPEQHP